MDQILIQDLCKCNSLASTNASNASSAASDWMQRESIDKLKKPDALKSGKRVWDKNVRSCPVKCEKMEMAMCRRFKVKEAMDSRLK